MSKTTKPEDLQKVLSDYLENYVEDITEDVEDTTDTLTKEAVQELKQTSPRGQGSRSKPYYKGWTRQRGKENRGRYTEILLPTKYGKRIRPESPGASPRLPPNPPSAAGRSGRCLPAFWKNGLRGRCPGRSAVLPFSSRAPSPFRNGTRD